MRPLDEEARRGGAALGRARVQCLRRHPLSAQELKQVFEKLHKYIGKSVEQLVNRPDAPHVFRLHKKACTRRGQPRRGLAARQGKGPRAAATRDSLHARADASPLLLPTRTRSTCTMCEKTS